MKIMIQLTSREARVGRFASLAGFPIFEIASNYRDLEPAAKEAVSRRRRPGFYPCPAELASKAVFTLK